MNKEYLLIEKFLKPNQEVLSIGSGIGGLETLIKKRIKNRQDAPIVYQLNGLFGINVNQFLKTGKRYTEKIVPFEIAPETGLMIDTEFEFELAKTIVEKKLLII